MGACVAARMMFSAISRRNTLLHAAASSNVSGGTSLVLVRPGWEAFAMTAMPQPAVSALSLERTTLGMSLRASLLPDFQDGGLFGCALTEPDSCRLASPPATRTRCANGPLTEA